MYKFLHQRLYLYKYFRSWLSEIGHLPNSLRMVLWLREAILRSKGARDEGLCIRNKCRWLSIPVSPFPMIRKFSLFPLKWWIFGNYFLDLYITFLDGLSSGPNQCIILFESRSMPLDDIHGLNQVRKIFMRHRKNLQNWTVSVGWDYTFLYSPMRLDLPKFWQISPN